MWYISVTRSRLLLKRRGGTTGCKSHVAFFMRFSLFVVYIIRMVICIVDRLSAIARNTQTRIFTLHNLSVEIYYTHSQVLVITTYMTSPCYIIIQPFLVKI